MRSQFRSGHPSFPLVALTQSVIKTHSVVPMLSVDIDNDSILRNADINTIHASDIAKLNLHADLVTYIDQLNHLVAFF